MSFSLLCGFMPSSLQYWTLAHFCQGFINRSLNNFAGFKLVLLKEKRAYERKSQIVDDVLLSIPV